MAGRDASPRRPTYFGVNPEEQKKSDVSEKRPYLKKERSPLDVVGRRALPHDPPHFIGTSDAVFFITICCQERGVNQICYSDVATILFDAARFYRDRNNGACRCFS